MINEYVAEFIASGVFLILITLSFYWAANKAGYILALLIALSLFIGNIVGQALKGPGYCNPLAAIALGTQGGKNERYIANMIGIEFLAAAVVILLYLAVIHITNSSKVSFVI
jgi:hypothetical protein